MSETETKPRWKTGLRLVALAALLANEGAFSEAAEHLELAVAYRPDSHRAQYNLAVMLAQLGRNTEAIQHYETASGLVPRPLSATLRETVAWYRQLGYC